MSLEAKLFSLLGPLVSNRVFPDTAPYNTTRPFITYQQIGGAVINPLANELPSKMNARIQINIWHNSRVAVRSLAIAVEDALRTATTMTARPESAPVAEYDSELALSGFRQDFSIWYDRT